MLFSMSTLIPAYNITIHGKRLDQVNRFIYLGSLFTSDGRCEQDIRRRIGIAESAFISMEKVIQSRNIDIQPRIRVLKCYVWITFVYGCETWTLSGDISKHLEAVEMCFLRRMIRISWTEKVTNEEVLHKANIDRKLLNDIVSRQMKFFGPFIRKEELENLVGNGFVEGKRALGRQKETYLASLQKSKDLTPMEFIRFAYGRHVRFGLLKQQPTSERYGT